MRERPACQRAARSLRDATALRVTPRPFRGSDGSYGPAARPGRRRPGRPRRLTGRGGRPGFGRVPTDRTRRPRGCSRRRRGRPVPLLVAISNVPSCRTDRSRGNRRRRLLPAGVLPVRCCPEPTAGRPREHSGPSGSRAACGPRQRHGKRARALRQCVTVEAARFPPRFGRRKRRPHGPQASSLLISIHDDRNRQKWLTPSGKSS